MSNPVQRGGTSANTSDNACAITIIAGQQSFQVNFVYFLRNILSKDIHTSRIPSHVPRCGHLLHRYSLIHCQLSIVTNNCYNTDLSGGLHQVYLVNFPKEVEEFIDNEENSNTRRKTKNNMFLLRSFMAKEKENRQFEEILPQELDNYLSRILLSVRKKNGDEYEPPTLD